MAHVHDRVTEPHFTAGVTVRDVVIGMSDGLTVPFALAAGLTGAVASARIIVTAGLAEIAAGSIAMGLGGYLAARGDREHYLAEYDRETRETVEQPEDERQEVLDVLMRYGMTAEQATPIVDSLAKDQKAWVDFMMRFELGLEEPDPSRAWKSAATIAGSYIIGGFVPLLPYMFLHSIQSALLTSVICTLIALFVFGYAKGRATGVKPLKSSIQTTLIGSTAAGAAFALARLFSH